MNWGCASNPWPSPRVGVASARRLRTRGPAQRGCVWMPCAREGQSPLEKRLTRSYRQPSLNLKVSSIGFGPIFLAETCALRHDLPMVKFISGVLEQLDLALEHLSKHEVHSARFGLMMTDNVLELVFHQIAKDKDRELRSWQRKFDEYPHKAALAEAQGQHFDAKVRFAKINGLIDEETSLTIRNLHGFRNQLYHAGLQHEEILPDLAEFYLNIACGVLAKHRIQSMSYGYEMRIPDRAKKYISFSEKTGHIMPKFEDFRNGCEKIAEHLDFHAGKMISSLCDHLDQEIDQFDICLQIAADGVYEGQKTTRNQAVVSSQIWPIMFSDEGKRFATENGWRGKTVRDFEVWMGENFPLKWRRDPVQIWRRRVNKMRATTNPHSSLSNYLRFMDETEGLRNCVRDTAAAAEAEIDRLIDERRGK